MQLFEIAETDRNIEAEEEYDGQKRSSRLSMNKVPSRLSIQKYMNLNENERSIDSLRSEYIQGLKSKNTGSKSGSKQSSRVNILDEE